MPIQEFPLPDPLQACLCRDVFEQGVQAMEQSHDNVTGRLPP